MHVLSIASEAAPLIKTGGLADVTGALPAALAPHDVHMRTLIPGYPAVMSALQDARQVASFDDLFGAPAALVAGRAAGLDLLVIDAAHLYARAGNIYLGPDGRDWPDNPERFAALSWVGAWIAAHGADGWRPDVLHGHDWQAGLMTEYLRQMPRAASVGTVLTIHNIAFIGRADAGRMHSLRLDPLRFHSEGYEYWGAISALKAGLMGADALTTVSPGYAQELMTPEFGMGLEGVMRHRRAALTGILNGIDTTIWNPATDPLIEGYHDPAGKAANTAALRAELDLPHGDGPLCVIVSRMTHQKGLDLMLEALPALLAGGGQLALLGSGDAWLEQAFSAAAADPNVAVRIGYDEALSHRMIAGGDAILVPSRFEPCGLTQLYGLRYGTVPVVALTGGLSDTVINASPAALAQGVATGIQFSPITVGALSGALSRVCDLHRDRAVWSRMVENAMAQPVGWDRSAQDYAALYNRLTLTR